MASNWNSSPGMSMTTDGGPLFGIWEACPSLFRYAGWICVLDGVMEEGKGFFDGFVGGCEGDAEIAWQVDDVAG
jgi:hypothetical protein